MPLNHGAGGRGDLHPGAGEREILLKEVFCVDGIRTKLKEPERGGRWTWGGLQ